MKFTIEEDSDREGSINWQELDRVPDGEHRLEIIHAEWRKIKWKECPANPEGNSLSLRLRLDNDHRLIFEDIPAQLGWRAKQLARAVGIEPSGTELELGPDELVDQVVEAVVVTYEPKSGADPVSTVKLFKPQVAAAPKKKAAAKRTPASQGVKISDASVADDPEDDGLPF